MIKKLLKSLREYKKETIITPLLMVLEVAMEVAIPYILTLFGEAIEKANSNGMILYGSLMVGASIISLIAGMLGGKYCAKASTGFAKNLRHDMFANVQKFSFSNIDKFSSSSLVTRLTTDVSSVQMAFMMVIRTAIRSPLMLIFSIVMSFSKHPTLPAIFFVTAPVLTFGIILIIKNAMPIFKRVFKRYDNLNESIQENVKGMRVVKAYVREDYETEKFSTVSTSLSKDFIKAERILALNGPIMQFCLQGALIAIALIGSRLMLNGDSSLSVWVIQSMLTYSLQILMSLQMLSMIFVMLTMSGESARRIVEVLDEKTDLTSPENAIKTVSSGDISFENVSFRYSSHAQRNVLDGINLSISSGETVGIIGATGSSKSTLVNLISRLYDVTEGELKVGGINVKEYDLEVLRDNVSVVLQKNVLFSGTVRENMKWGDKNATDEEIIKALKIAQAYDFIMSSSDGLDKEVEQGGANFSGGQKQRLCIARALVKKPKILILDDSTSAVDMKTDALLRKAFKEELPSVTKIIIAQRIASVQDSDKIVVLDGGKINAVGTHSELIKNNEIYKEVYYSQNKVENNDGEVASL
ncbi:MAG: ABC transporter ATP-binding protein [Clostridia bacterium]|nr:ABC transporter ATP-binding protein [Clostridia bacterium]